MRLPSSASDDRCANALAWASNDSAAGIGMVERLPCQVTVDEQKEPHDCHDDGRYVSLSE